MLRASVGETKACVNAMIPPVHSTPSSVCLLDPRKSMWFVHKTISVTPKHGMFPTPHKWHSGRAAHRFSELAGFFFCCKNIQKSKISPIILTCVTGIQKGFLCLGTE